MSKETKDLTNETIRAKVLDSSIGLGDLSELLGRELEAIQFYIYFNPELHPPKYNHPDERSRLWHENRLVVEKHTADGITRHEWGHPDRTVAEREYGNQIDRISGVYTDGTAFSDIQEELASS